MLAIAAAVSAVPVIYQQPLLAKAVDLDAPAEYEFSYSVQDDHTGDIKSQHETRKGDDVKGVYTLIDADGYLRTVTYTADEHNGFNAIVSREPAKGYQGPKLAKVALVPKAYIAPVAKLALAPIAKVALAHPAAATVSINAHGTHTVY